MRNHKGRKAEREEKERREQKNRVIVKKGNNWERGERVDGREEGEGEGRKIIPPPSRKSNIFFSFGWGGG
jgi:hypothetical protein